MPGPESQGGDDMRVVLEGTEAQVIAQAGALLHRLLSSGARISGLRVAVESLMADGRTRRQREILDELGIVPEQVCAARSAIGHLYRYGVLARTQYGAYAHATATPGQAMPCGPTDHVRRLMDDGRARSTRAVADTLGLSSARAGAICWSLACRGELRRTRRGVYVSTSAAPSDTPATVTPTEVTSAAAAAEEAAPARRDDCAGAAEEEGTLIERVLALMQDGEERTPVEVAYALGVTNVRQALRALDARGQLARVRLGVYVLPSAERVTVPELVQAEPVAEAPEPEARRSPAYVSPPLGDRLAEAAERAWEARRRRLEWLGVGT
jgi:hypothetical protein